MPTKGADGGWAKDLELLDSRRRALGRDEECFAVFVASDKGEGLPRILLGEKAPRGCATCPEIPPSCVTLGMAVLCGSGERIEIEVRRGHRCPG